MTKIEVLNKEYDIIRQKQVDLVMAKDNMVVEVVRNGYMFNGQIRYGPG